MVGNSRLRIFVIDDEYHFRADNNYQMNLVTDDSCFAQFENLKFRKTGLRFIIYSIEKQRIVVERLGKLEETWDSFVHSLPEDCFRYGVFDFEFTNKDKMAISKILFVSWCPDGASIKNRINYAAAKEGFKKYLGFTGKEYTLNSKGDMSGEEMIKELSK